MPQLEFPLAGTPALIGTNAKVREAYLGSGTTTVRQRPNPLGSKQPLELDTVGVEAGYGRVPVLESITIAVRQGELIALLAPTARANPRSCAP